MENKVPSLDLQNLNKSIHISGRWIDGLFNDYRLFPIIGSDSTTHRMLTSQSLTNKILDLVLSRANLSSLVNSLTGINLLSDPKEGGLLAEAYDIIQKHRELEKTITDRITSTYRKTVANQMAFAAVRESLSLKRNPFSNSTEFLKPLSSKINSVNDKFVSVDGILCRVENIRAIAGATIAKALEDSKIKWVLADYPYFCMGHSGFRNGVVLLSMDEKVVENIENELPFWRETGWFPYVRVSGMCRYPHSTKYGYPSISPSWIQYRTPKNPLEVIEKVKTAYADATGSFRYEGFNVVKDNPFELTLFKDVVRILAKGANLDVSDLPGIGEILADADKRAGAAKQAIFLK